VFTTSGTYPWSFVTSIFHNGQPSRGGDRNTESDNKRNKRNKGSVTSLILFI